MCTGESSRYLHSSSGVDEVVDWGEVFEGFFWMFFRGCFDDWWRECGGLHEGFVVGGDSRNVENIFADFLPWIMFIRITRWRRERFGWVLWIIFYKFSICESRLTKACAMITRLIGLWPRVTPRRDAVCDAMHSWWYRRLRSGRYEEKNSSMIGIFCWMLMVFWFGWKRYEYIINDLKLSLFARYRRVISNVVLAGIAILVVVLRFWNKEAFTFNSSLNLLYVKRSYRIFSMYFTGY